MPTIPRRTSLVILAAGLLGGRRAAAHHGWGSYEAGAPVDVTGTVERMSFDNPHGTLWLKAPEKTWEVVLAPPSRLRSRGVSPDMLAVGTEVEAYGYPHRSREVEMRAEWIKVAGQTYQLR
jgi:hypothetical protein